MKTCPYCQNELHGRGFCPHCMHRLRSVKRYKNKKFPHLFAREFMVFGITTLFLIGIFAFAITYRQRDFPVDYVNTTGGTTTQEPSSTVQESTAAPSTISTSEYPSEPVNDSETSSASPTINTVDELISALRQELDQWMTYSPQALIQGNGNGNGYGSSLDSNLEQDFKGWIDSLTRTYWEDAHRTPYYYYIAIEPQEDGTEMFYIYISHQDNSSMPA